MRACS